MTISIKVELRKEKCPNCKGILYKCGHTTNGLKIRYICPSCNNNYVIIK